MIARIWHGWTAPDKADVYQTLLEGEVLPGIESRTSSGYEGVLVLRREGAAETEFVTVTLWASMEDVKTMAGEDVEAAYVPQEAREVLARFDERSVHYEIVAQVGVDVGS